MTTPFTHRHLRNITVADFIEDGFSGDQLDVLLDIIEGQVVSLRHFLYPYPGVVS